MNARWFRNNLSVLIISVVFLGILGTLVWFLQQARAEQATVLQDLEAQQGELSRYQDTKPYPSKENIAILKSDQTEVKQLYGLMHTAAVREIIQPPELERDIDFMQLKNTTIANLTDSADKNMVKVGDAFTWGFSRYIATFPCRNPVAKGEDCKRLLRLLAKQLMIVQNLGELLINSKVESIQAIRRTEVEAGTSADALNAPIIDNPTSLYRVYPFEVEFTSTTDALRNFLNALAQADNLYVIRSVRIATVSQQVQAPAASVPQTDTDSGAITPKVPEPVKTIETRRVSVIVRVDEIEFKPVKKQSVKH